MYIPFAFVVLVFLGGRILTHYLLQYVAGSLMALSLNDKGYSCFNIQVPSLKDLAEIATLTGPLILTMVSKVATSLFDDHLQKLASGRTANNGC